MTDKITMRSDLGQNVAKVRYVSVRCVICANKYNLCFLKNFMLYIFYLCLITFDVVEHFSLKQAVSCYHLH